MRVPFFFAVFIVLVTTSFSQVSADAPGGRFGAWHDGWGWGHMMFGSLMMILFWGGLVLLVVLVIRWLSGGTANKGGMQETGPRPLDILEERFARGDIDKEDFEERKRLLSK